MINVKREGKRNKGAGRRVGLSSPLSLEIHCKSKLPPPSIVIPFLNPKPNMGLNAKVWSTKFINWWPHIKTKLPQGQWLSGIALFGISQKKMVLGFKPHCVNVMKALLWPSLTTEFDLGRANGLSVRSGLVLCFQNFKNTNKSPIHIVKTSSQSNQKTNVEVVRWTDSSGWIRLEANGL